MTILNPTFSTANRVLVVPGASTLTTSKLLVATLYDPVSTPVQVVCNGRTYTSGTDDFTLVSRAANPSRWTTGTSVDGCWTGLLELTGLEPFTRYPFTVTQGVRSNDGSTMTAPRKTDTFVLPTGTCHGQNNVTFGNWRVEGFWEHIYDLAHSGVAVPGIFWVDDWGYPLLTNVGDTISMTGYEASTATCTGLQSSHATNVPHTTLDVDDFLMGWCAGLGMLGPDEFGEDWKALADLGYVESVLARGTRKDWCRRNINIYAVEAEGNFAQGWEKAATDYPNVRWLEDGVDGAGKVAERAFVGLITPAKCKDVLGTPRDTVADHWVCEFGPITMVGIDTMTHGDGAIPNTESPYYASDGLGGLVQVNKLMGNDQIADILELVHQYKNPINLIGMSHSLRYPVSSYSSLTRTNSGAQNPIYDHVLPEYQRFITASGQTPPSLMDSKYTNGALGQTIFVHGDYHQPHVWKFHAPAYAGNLAENFYSINPGTLDGSMNRAVSDQNAINGSGQTAANITSIYFNPAIDPEVGLNNFWGLLLEVDGSRPVSCTYKLQDRNGATLATETWHQYGGNLPSERPPAFAGSPSPASE